VRDDLEFWCKPSNAEFFFQECVDAVEGAPRTSAGDDEFVLESAQRKPLRAEFADIEWKMQSSNVGIVAHKDLARDGSNRVFNDRQLHQGNGLKIMLQFLGSIPFGRGCI